MTKIKFDQRIVVTCTTLPDRYPSLIKTLQMMKDQDCHIDLIYLTIPYKARRLNKVYPELPTDIYNFCKIIRIKKDYGPLCKMYGALYNEHDKETIIISIDDDCIYPKDLISHMIKLSIKHPQVAICGTGALIGRGLTMASIYNNLSPMNKLNILSGFRISNEGRCVDVIHGFAGVLYRRGFFPKKEKLNNLFKLPFINDNVFCHDDLILSGYLRKRGIKLKTFKDMPLVQDCVKESDALSYNFSKMIEKFKHTIKCLQREGLFLDFEPSAIDENPFMKLIYIIFFIVVIILFIYFMFFKQPHQFNMPRHFTLI
jgi:hypothetical protein